MYEDQINEQTLAALWKRDSQEARRIRGTQICRTCEEDMPFVRKEYTCKACLATYMRDYTNTVHGFITAKANRIKTLMHKEKFIQDKSVTPHDNAVTYDELRALARQQGDKCFLSHLPLQFGRLREWQASVERLDDKRGYMLGNIAWCCLEFNVPSKWTPEKIESIPGLLQQDVDLESLDAQVQSTRDKSYHRPLGRKSYYRRPPQIFRGVKGSEETQCSECGIWRELLHYLENSRTCRECEVKKRGEFGHFLHNMLNASSHRKFKRGEKDRPCTLTMDHILDKIIEQEGRCQVSGIPLHFGTRIDWKCSLERVDTTKGYTDANVTLICAEFNSSVIHSPHEYGTTQWSREKFLHFMSVRFPTVEDGSGAVMESIEQPIDKQTVVGDSMSEHKRKRKQVAVEDDHQESAPQKKFKTLREFFTAFPLAAAAW
jgi:hypothetical protein